MAGKTKTTTRKSQPRLPSDAIVCDAAVFGYDCAVNGCDDSVNGRMPCLVILLGNLKLVFYCRYAWFRRQVVDDQS